MTQIETFQFGPDSRPAKYAGVSDSRLINAFVEEVADGKGGVKYAIHGDPGLDEFADSSESGIRGSFLIGTQLYTVAGETLYKVSSGGTLTSIGTVTGSRSIIAAVNRANPPQVAIVADSEVYELQADVLQTWQDADLPDGAISVDYMDGYFIFFFQNGFFYITGIDDTTVDALDVASADSRSDGGVRGFVYERRLWLYGEKTIEEWINTGNADFPFEKGSGFVECGLLAKHSLVELDSSMAFIDHRGRVVRLQGYSPQVLSSPAVERDIRQTMDQQRTDEIEAFVYFEAGHEFMQISGPDWTWVYDAATRLWHPKESYLSDRARHRTYIRAYDKHLVGSNDDGKIFEMSMDSYVEDDDPLVVRMRSPVLGPWPARVRWHNLILDLEMGVGDGSSDQHTGTPDLMMRYSDDGGSVWSSEFQAELGEIGEHRKRVKFNRLGISSSQGRMFEIAISAGVRRTIINASAMIEVLSA